MDEIKEGLLTKRAQSGDIEAFEKLIKEHEKMVYSIVYKIIQNHEDTYDVSQETFIKVYTKIKQFNHKSKFSTWIYTIATNTALDELRKIKRQKEVSIDKPLNINGNKILRENKDKKQNVEKDILEKEGQMVIDKALNNLSENHKVILTLRDIQGFSYDEISNILNISLGTVKSRISRGRKELKDILIQDKEPFRTYFRHITTRGEKA